MDRHTEIRVEGPKTRLDNRKLLTKNIRHHQTYTFNRETQVRTSSNRNQFKKRASIFYLNSSNRHFYSSFTPQRNSIHIERER